jgi:hypothetical protein
VNRDADRPALIGKRPGDCLANPPRGIGRELVPSAEFKLLDRAHQAGISFLNQVQEAQAAIAVALGDRNDQP